MHEALTSVPSILSGCGGQLVRVLDVLPNIMPINPGFGGVETGRSEVQVTKTS